MYTYIADVHVVHAYIDSTLVLISDSEEEKKKKKKDFSQTASPAFQKCVY